MEVKAELLNGTKGATATAKTLFKKSSSINLSSISNIKRDIMPKLVAVRDDMISASVAETGFSQSDANELVHGAITFVDNYKVPNITATNCPTMSVTRQITVSAVPIGCIFTVLPANAFLYLAVVVAMNALATGNQVVLRSSASTKETARLLAQVFEGIQAVSIVSAPAPELVKAFCKSEGAGLFHYFGSSNRIPELAEQCAAAGKSFIAEGEGNVWVYVDEGSAPGEVGAILFDGSTRYNGETCTSINGAIIHPSLYEDVKREALARFASASDDGEASDDIQKLAQKSHGEVSTWGSRIVIEQPKLSSDLVLEGFFGPALWICSGTLEEFRELWLKNSYPLCAGYLGPNPPQDLQNLPNLARLVINGDPSIEDPLEPWGGYGRSGISRVERWHEKYVRFVQTDSPAKI